MPNLTMYNLAMLILGISCTNRDNVKSGDVIFVRRIDQMRHCQI